MSDMAPNISGNRAMDQPRSMALLDEALVFASEVLRPGRRLPREGVSGRGHRRASRASCRTHFKTVKTIKPKASRPESREIYLLARSFGM